MKNKNDIVYSLWDVGAQQYFKRFRKTYYLGAQAAFIVFDLTKKEYKLLSYLVLNKNRVLDRLQLTEHIWGEFFEDDYDSNYIDVHIKNIRKKLS
ncbi:MAG: winged helix-turn-helix domain-containing protein, partial [Desulfobacterales bacterium]